MCGRSQPDPLKAIHSESDDAFKVSFPVPPCKNILPSAPKTSLQIVLGRIKTLLVSPVSAEAETFGTPKLALILMLIMLFIQIGLTLIPIQHKFIAGVLCWLVVWGLCSYIIWVWRKTRRLTFLGKFLLCLLIAITMVLLLWRPEREQFLAEHHHVAAESLSRSAPFGPGPELGKSASKEMPKPEPEKHLSQPKTSLYSSIKISNSAGAQNSVRTCALKLKEELREWVAGKIKERAGWTDPKMYMPGSDYQKRAAKDYEKKFGPAVRMMAEDLERCGADVQELKKAINDLAIIFDFPHAVSWVAFALQDAAYDIPGGQPECGTGNKARISGFREKDTGIYTLVTGGSAIGFSEDQLTKGPISAGQFGGKDLFQIYLLNQHFYVDTKLYAEFMRPEVEIRRNEVAVINPAWDSNHTDAALEVVNENRVPMLQMIFETPRKVQINGVFQLDEHKMMIVSPGHSQLIDLDPRAPNQQIQVPLRPLFKYPSWTYPGKYADN